MTTTGRGAGPGPRAAPPPALVLVAAGVAASVLVAVLVGFRAAGYLLALVVAAAALARLVLPEGAGRGLAVRSPLVDTLISAALAATLVLLAGTAPG